MIFRIGLHEQRQSVFGLPFGALHFVFSVGNIQLIFLSFLLHGFLGDRCTNLTGFSGLQPFP